LIRVCSVGSHPNICGPLASTATTYFSDVAAVRDRRFECAGLVQRRPSARGRGSFASAVGTVGVCFAAMTVGGVGVSRTWPMRRGWMRTKGKWSGVGQIKSVLRRLGADTADPFASLPARPRGMWRRTYERLAAEFRRGQDRPVRSLAQTAQWSMAQERHQLAYGRLAKQRKARRERMLDLGAKQREALNSRYWTKAQSCRE
jgi:hypothetical protein